MKTKLFEVCYDAGNRGQVLAVNNKILTRPAAIARPGTLVRHASRPRVDYLDLDGETVIIGDRSVPGSKSVHQEDLGDDTAKVRNARAFILAMSADPSLEMGDKAEISRVRMMHPNPSPAVLQELHKALVGTHKVKVNGREVTREIQEVVLYPEPVPSYYHLVSQGMVNPSEVVFLADIGGKTTCLQGFANGQPLPDFGRRYLDVGGVKQLALKLARAIESEGLTGGKAANLDAIMDAMELAFTSQTQTRKYFYGSGRNQFDFSHLVGAGIKNWALGILSELMVVTSDYDESLSQVWFVGGGSHYIRPALTLPGFIVADEPELTNIRGLLALTNPEVLQKNGCPLPEAVA